MHAQALNGANRKWAAIEKEDYDLAKAIKGEIEGIRAGKEAKPSRCQVDIAVDAGMAPTNGITDMAQLNRTPPPGAHSAYAQGDRDAVLYLTT